MTRRRFAVFTFLALAAAACADNATPPGTLPATTTIPPTATTTTGATTSPERGRPVTLVTIFDGDTILVSMDGAEEEVRLLGVNTPESGECFAREARGATTAMLEGTALTVEIVGERDQYGRLLAYAYAGGILVNRALLDGGYALALQSDHPRLAEFLAAEEAAYEGRQGLWAPDACGPSVAANVSLLEMSADPPGPDEDDLNGEWVFFANDGPQVVDLTGWVLRDESSQNRYHFPDGFRFHPGEGLAVYSGCGEDGPVTLYWCADDPVWNNGGDTVLLLDPSGNVVVRLRYP